jgi:hypothetical protein
VGLAISAILWTAKSVLAQGTLEDYRQIFVDYGNYQSAGDRALDGKINMLDYAMVAMLPSPTPMVCGDLINDNSLENIDVSFIGENAHDRSGGRVAGAGDVNGDGYDDFLISTNSGETRPAKVYLILGRESGWDQITELTNADASFYADGSEGKHTNSLRGVPISGTGDTNGDGYDDFSVGDSQADEGQGRTYLVLGKSDGWQRDSSLAQTAITRFVGEEVSDYSGISVSGAGDVNGDGYDDLMIGSKNRQYIPDPNGGNWIYDPGQTYLLLGNSEGWGSVFSLAGADASYLGEGLDDSSGSGLRSAGDVNADGYSDFLIGSPFNNNGDIWTPLRGQTYLILGKTDGWTMRTSLENADASFVGEGGGDFSGQSVSGGGDVDGDGYDDILIGAFFYSVSNRHLGKSYLTWGKPDGWEMRASLTFADGSFLGEDYGATYGNISGYSVSGGDVNGDGYSDMLIGGYGYGASNPDIFQRGQSHLMLGKDGDWGQNYSLENADASFLGEGADDQSGMSVSIAGDVNGDGYNDLLIGAPGNSEGGIMERGKTYLIFGCPTN